jgi:hypothetical protein
VRASRAAAAAAASQSAALAHVRGCGVMTTTIAGGWGGVRYISAARDFRRQLSKQLAALRGGDVDAGVVRHRSELEDLLEQEWAQAQVGGGCWRAEQSRARQISPVLPPPSPFLFATPEMPPVRCCRMRVVRGRGGGGISHVAGRRRRRHSTDQAWSWRWSAWATPLCARACHAMPCHGAMQPGRSPAPYLGHVHERKWEIRGAAMGAASVASF